MKSLTFRCTFSDGQSGEVCAMQNHKLTIGPVMLRIPIQHHSLTDGEVFLRRPSLQG